MVLVELIDFISISHAASNRKTIEARSFVYLDRSLRRECKTEGLLRPGSVKLFRAFRRLQPLPAPVVPRPWVSETRTSTHGLVRS